MYKYVVLVYLLSRLLIPTAFADEQPKDEGVEQANIEHIEQFINGYVQSMIGDYEPPGMMVSVVIGDQQITKGYGIADASENRAVDEHTLFRVGSISKLFVWLSAHRLADQGLLDLDADINRYLGENQIVYAFDRTITMRDLMAHRAGFDDHIREFFAAERDITLEETIRLNRPEQVAEPGERTSYSNTGTNMAAYIIEQITGESYYDFVHREILTPVGMTSTVLRDPNSGLIPPDLRERLAKPHRMSADNAQVTNYMEIRPQEPAGSVSLDATDASKFLRFLLNQTNHDTGRLVSAEAWSLIGTHAYSDASGGDDIGWGFMLNDIDGYKTIGHGGTTQFVSTMFIIPQLDMGVFISSNMNSNDSRPNRLARAIVREVLGSDRLASFLRLEGNSEAANEVAGRYLTNRRPQSYGASVMGMGRDITIQATDDGYLIFPRSRPTRYAPIGDDIWLNLEGERMHVFRDQNGAVIRVQANRGTATYDRIDFISSSSALTLGFGGSLLFSFTGLLGMYYRHGRRKPLDVVTARMNWLNVSSVFVWLLFFSAVIIAGIAMGNVDLTAIDETPFPPTSVRIAFALTIIVALQSFIHCLSIVVAWKYTSWSVLRKFNFTVYGILMAFAVYLMSHWDVIGGSIYDL